MWSSSTCSAAAAQRFTSCSRNTFLAMPSGAAPARRRIPMRMMTGPSIASRRRISRFSFPSSLPSSAASRNGGSLLLQRRRPNTIRFQRIQPRGGLPGRRSFADNSRNSLESTEGMAARLKEIGEQTGGLTSWMEGLSAHQREQLTNLLRGAKEAVSNNVPEPSRRALRLVALNTAIPFVGFGFLDNAILIVAGDAIDTSLGVVLGISTMCAAALGNIISDVAGILLGTAIEDFCVNHLKLPSPDLSSAQRQLRSVRFASQWGCAIGVVVGCIIGMFPLLFLDSNKVQARKREAHLDQLFRDVVTSAGSLVGAARTSMYLLVNPDNEEDGSERSSGGGNAMFHRMATKEGSPRPVPDGKYLYVKYEDSTAGPSKSELEKKEQWIRLGRGIVSRAILTGEAWNIADVSNEADFAPDVGYAWDGAPGSETRSMVCVPIMNSAGRPIAVIQAINKVGRGREDLEEGKTPPSSSHEPRPFSESDVQILKALASHISVSLQRMYEQAEGDQAETRLKDTIRLLHDYGLAGISSKDADDTQGLGIMKLARRPLFPED